MLELRGKIILAPLAGITDAVFRAICKRHGADVVVTEMVSADGIAYNSRATNSLMEFAPEERPIGIQLFGADPQTMAQAARYVEEKFRPDFIDLNAGCPVRKVVGKNGGSALLKDRPLFERILRAMVKAVSIPVTAKIRSSWLGEDWVDVDFAKTAQGCGAAAVTLHPRTRSQGFSGSARWERIAIVKQAVSIPVVGNGDIVKGADAARMISQTGCDSVMIGRGAMGNPWIFEQCRAALSGHPPQEPTRQQRVLGALEHLDAYIRRFGDHQASKDMKKHLSWYLTGMPGVAAVRNLIMHAQSTDQMREALGGMQI